MRYRVKPAFENFSKKKNKKNVQHNDYFVIFRFIDSLRTGFFDFRIGLVVVYNLHASFLAVKRKQYLV